MERSRPTYPVRVTEEGRRGRLRQPERAATVHGSGRRQSRNRDGGHPDRRVRPGTPRSGTDAASAAAEPLDCSHRSGRVVPGTTQADLRLSWTRTTTDAAHTWPAAALRPLRPSLRARLVRRVLRRPPQGHRRSWHRRHGTRGAVQPRPSQRPEPSPTPATAPASSSRSPTASCARSSATTSRRSATTPSVSCSCRSRRSSARRRRRRSRASSRTRASPSSPGATCRCVPTASASTARAVMPSFRQLVVTDPDGAAGIDLDRKTFVVRKRIEHELEDEIAVPAVLSARTLVYKGMLTTPQLAAASTPTSWTGASRAPSPSCTAASRRTRSASGRRPPLPLHRPQRGDQHGAGQRELDAGARRCWPARTSRARTGVSICTPGASDTARFDEALELRCTSAVGRSITPC